MDTRSNFLEVTDDNPNEFLSLQAAAAELDKLYSSSLDQYPDPSSFKTIKPEPGFCVKTKSTDQKVFLNICTSSQLPKPVDITEDELIAILQSDEPSSYRVPMSLGEPHFEKDKGGDSCVAYDIIINNEYFTAIKKNELFKTFLITLCIEGIEDKYGTYLNKESYVILKNKKYHGTMPEHFIKNHPKKLITEMTSKSAAMKSSKQPSNEVPIEKKKKVTSENSTVPKYSIFRHTPPGHSEMLIARFSLPGMKSKEVNVDLGEDRIILQTSSNTYACDLFLPYLVDQNNTKAHFHTRKQVLTLVMPVHGKV